MWRWAIAACLSLLATVAVGAPADADSPLRLLERMSTALATKNYDGEFLRMADGRVDRFRIVHRREAQGYTERVQLLVGAGRIGREIIRKNKINDMIFALGMYGAMSNGTINMMRNLGKQSGVYIPPKPVINDSIVPAVDVLVPAKDTTSLNQN